MGCARTVPLEHRPIARSGCRCGEPEECLRHWRDDATLRPRVRRVNPHSTHRQLRDHRVTANRAARRRRQCPWPGHRPGRREAESIDDGEHGASIIGAVVDRRDVVPSRDATVRQQLGLTVGAQAAPFSCTIRTHLKRRGTPAPDGVNDPLPTPWGQPLGTVVGSFTPSSLLRHRQPQGFTRRQTAPPRLENRANSRDIKRLRGSHVHG